jgi:hypothetical protein
MLMPAPGESAGDSKLPFIKACGSGPTVSIKVTLSNNKSIAVVAEEVSVNVNVELVLVAMNVKLWAGP